MTVTIDEPSIQRERIEALMLFRVILVTLFLGGALLIDVGALADFSSIRNITIVGLIVGTYALTIFYALLLRAGAALRELTVTQLTLDIVIVGVLVDAYGAIDSPFLFLYLLIVISAALTLGRRAALNVAAAVTAMLALLAAQRLGLFEAEPAPGAVWKTSLFRVALNGSAAMIVALLAGYLTELLGKATTQLEAQRVSLEELRALNDNILASLSSGLLTIDDNEHVIFFNRAAEQITGKSAEDVLGRDVNEVMPEIGALLDEPQAEVRQEVQLERSGGGVIYLGFSITPLVDAVQETTGRIVIFQDLSQIKALETQMRRSERLAVVGRLSAAIAHEIRNPLASISGSVEMLSENPEAAEDDRVLMNIVLREVARLDSLISDFLDYSRPRPLQLEFVKPAAIIERVLELFRNRERDLKLEVMIAPDLPRLAVDIEAMKQVLWNLLNNAVDAVKGRDDATIRVIAESTMHSVVIAIEDNGPGIPSENIDRIFQPFFTTKSSGTGLGLATMFRLVEDHGARCIVVAHGELGGARFEIVFDRVSEVME